VVAVWQPEIPGKIAVRRTPSRDDSDRKHAVRHARHDFDCIQKRVRSHKIQMNASVTLRFDVGKNFCGCGIALAGVIHDI